jgi:tol-pal system protein YbgF
MATHPVDSIRLNSLNIDSLEARVAALESRPVRVVAAPKPPPLATIKPHAKNSAPTDAAEAPTVADSPSSANTAHPVKEKPKGKTTGPEAALYDRAFKEYYARTYGKAIQTFQALLKQFPEGDFADNAHYWIGECEFSLGNYGKAILAFQKVFGYGGTEKADDAQLKLGYCHLRMGDRKRAGDEFRKVVSLYPDSEYLERAKDELARLEP